MDGAASIIASTESPGQRLRRRAYETLPLLVCLLAVAFLSVRINKGIYLGDEGAVCMGGWRISQGETPNADFFQIETPLSFYLEGWTFDVFGPSVLADRSLGFVYGLLLVALVYALAGVLLRSPLLRAAALSALIPFGVGAWPFPSHHWLVDLCQLACLWCLFAGIRSSRTGWMVLGGVLAVAGALSLEDQGLYGLIAASILLPATLPPLHRLRLSLGWLGGVCAAGLAAIVLLLSKMPLGQLWYDWAVFPLTQYGGGQGSMWAAAGGWSDIVRGLTWSGFSAYPFYISVTLLSYGLLCFLPLLAAAGAAFCLKARWPSLQLAGALVAIGAAFLGCAAHRWSIMNLTWASPGLVLVVAVAADGLWEARHSWARFTVRGVATLCLLVFGAFGVAGLWHQSTSPQYTIFAPAGSLTTFDGRQANALQEFINAIGHEVPPGAPAFCWGYIPMVNFLTEHPNPTPFNLMVTSPPYNSARQVSSWIKALDRDSVQWGFSHAFPVQPGDPAAAYLKANYAPAWTNGAYTLWRRKSQYPFPR